MKKLLFVDDDLNILKGFKRYFSRSKSDWCVFYAATAGEAIDLLTVHEIDVVVTDMHMPNMTGLKLLEFVRDNYPYTIRVILSGDRNTDEILSLVKVAHRYLIKPFSISDIINMVDRVYYLKKIVLSKRAQKLVTSIDTIPSLPSLYRDVINAAEADKSMVEIGKIIAEDVGMSVNILKLVNSAFFGITREILSVEMAVSLLGTNVIKSLILTVHMFQAFKGIPSRSIESLMNHSTITGAFSKAIVLDMGVSQKEADIAFISGLLHDVGRLIFMSSYADKYTDVFNRVKADETLSIIEIEEAVITSTHAEVGAYLLGIWGFTDEIVEAVSFHHSPEKNESENITNLVAVHLADVFEYQIIGSDEAVFSTPLNRDFLNNNGYTDEMINHWYDLCENLAKSFDD